MIENVIERIGREIGDLYKRMEDGKHDYLLRVVQAKIECLQIIDEEFKIEPTKDEQERIDELNRILGLDYE